MRLNVFILFIVDEADVFVYNRYLSHRQGVYFTYFPKVVPDIPSNVR